MKKIITICLISLLSGCAFGPKFSGLQNINDDEGVVYILRPSHVGSFFSTYIEVDGKEYGSIGSEEYIRIVLKSGNHKIFIPKNFSFPLNNTIRLNVKPGKRYYYGFLDPTGRYSILYRTHEIRFQAISEEHAHKLMRKLGLREST